MRGIIVKLLAKAKTEKVWTTKWQSLTDLILTIILMPTGKVIIDPNEPYFFWVEMSWAWADDSNDVSHLSISHL